MALTFTNLALSEISDLFLVFR